MDRFSSDLHLGHRGGYLSCKRDQDFRSLNHMNRSIIRKWNDTVTENDTVFLLGDFCYRSSRPAGSWLNEMNHGATAFESASLMCPRTHFRSLWI